jgi:MFS family permease
MTDRFGRRRVLTYSILIYAISAFLSGFATSIQMLLFLRCLVFIGVCVEFVAAVAWLAELFPEPKRREKVLGYTQAFSSLGGLLVATANGLCVAYAASLPALILIRPFLPESPIWQSKKQAGTLRRPSFAELFSPALRRTTIVTTVMFAMAYGAAFGAIQQIPQIVPGLPEVRQMVAGRPAPEARLTEQRVAADVTKFQEIGGLVGRVALAWLAVVVVSRRSLIRMFQIPGLILVPLTFAWAARTDLQILYPLIFLAGFFTVAQFSFWGNYLPRVYPVHLRGTGESFAANIGGRLVGTSFAWVTATLAVTADRAYAPTKVALVAAAVGFSVYLVGLIASAWLPEPAGESLE